MRRGGFVVWLVLAGCGRFGFDGAAADAGSDPADAEVVDATPFDAAPLGPFGPAELVTELMTVDGVQAPSLSADQLEIYYIVNDSTGLGGDIWRATRAANDDPWSNPEPVVELNSTEGELTPDLSHDGLVIRFASRRSSVGGSTDLFVASRLDRNSAWSAPVPIAELNTSDFEFSAVTNDSDTILVFDRGTVDNLLLSASRASPSDPWSSIVELTELNTAGLDAAAFLSADGLTLYFSTNRFASGNIRDIMVATRVSVSDPFDPPTALDEINSVDGEKDPWVSPDGRTIYFDSNRSGEDQLYRAAR